MPWESRIKQFPTSCYAVRPKLPPEIGDRSPGCAPVQPGWKPSSWNSSKPRLFSVEKMTFVSLKTEGWKIDSALWMEFCDEWVCLEQGIHHVGCHDDRIAFSWMMMIFGGVESRSENCTLPVDLDQDLRVRGHRRGWGRSCEFVSQVEGEVWEGSTERWPGDGRSSDGGQFTSASRANREVAWLAACCDISCLRRQSRSIFIRGYIPSLVMLFDWLRVVNGRVSSRWQQVHRKWGAFLGLRARDPKAGVSSFRVLRVWVGEASPQDPTQRLPERWAPCPRPNHLSSGVLLQLNWDPQILEYRLVVRCRHWPLPTRPIRPWILLVARSSSTA